MPRTQERSVATASLPEPRETVSRLSRRRFLASSLGAAAVATLLAACGSTTPVGPTTAAVSSTAQATAPIAPTTAASAPMQATMSAPPATPMQAKAAQVTLDVWHIFTGALGTAFTDLTKQFTAQQPAITINATYVPYDAMLQNLLSAVAAGNPPAMAGMEMTLPARLAAANALTPIEQLGSPAAATALKDSLIPSIRDANSFNGMLYTVPMGYNSNQLYYNPDLVRKAGLDPTRDLPKTWDALIAASPKFTANKTSSTQADVWGYGFPSRAPWIMEVRFWQSGAELFDAAGKQPLFNSDQGVAMFENYRRLQAAGGALVVPTDSALNQLTDLFAAGKVAMFEQSSTAFGGIAGKAPFQVGVSGFPTMGKPVFSMGGYNLGIFKQVADDKRQAAYEFARWWASPEPAAKWTAASNYMPGVTAAWDTDTLKKWRSDDPRRAVAADQLPMARPRPNLPQYPQIADALSDAFEATMNGQSTSKAALDGAATKAKELLSR